jgi:NAD(P)H-flavin reductase
MKIIGAGKYISFKIPMSFQSAILPGSYTNCMWSDGLQIHKQTTVIVNVVNNECEFLVDAKSRLGVAVANGFHIYMGSPSGGFKINDITRPIICIAGGGGIAGIIPLLSEFKHRNLDVTTYYCERSADMFVTSDFDILAGQGTQLHHVETEGALSLSEHVSIISILTALSNTQPLKFLIRPIVYACGPMGLINRLKSDLVPYHVDVDDFRLNF